MRSASPKPAVVTSTTGSPVRVSSALVATVIPTFTAVTARDSAHASRIARAEGYAAHSVDYRGIDEPRARVARLVDFCKELTGDLVLVGSSLGGYVAVTTASLLHSRGVFLMAPALYMDGLPELRRGILDCPTSIVHGWQDE